MQHEVYCSLVVRAWDLRKAWNTWTSKFYWKDFTYHGLKKVLSCCSITCKNFNYTSLVVVINLRVRHCRPRFRTACCRIISLLWAKKIQTSTCLMFYRRWLSWLFLGCWWPRGFPLTRLGMTQRNFSSVVTILQRKSAPSWPLSIAAVEDPLLQPSDSTSRSQLLPAVPTLYVACRITNVVMYSLSFHEFRFERMMRCITQTVMSSYCCMYVLI